MINDDIQKEVNRQVKFLQRSLKELHMTQQFLDDLNLSNNLYKYPLHSMSDYKKRLFLLIRCYGLEGNFISGRFYLIVSSRLFGIWTNMKYPNWTVINNILLQNYNIMRKLIRL